MSNLVGMPGLADQPRQVLAHGFMLSSRQVVVITAGQCFCNGIVFLNQRTACYLGWVCRQNQLDVQRIDLLHDPFRAKAFILQTT